MNGNFKVNVVRGIIMVATAAGALLALCVTKKEDPIDTIEENVINVAVSEAEEVSTEEATEG